MRFIPLSRVTSGGQILKSSREMSRDPALQDPRDSGSPRPDPETLPFVFSCQNVGSMKGFLCRSIINMQKGYFSKK